MNQSKRLARSNKRDIYIRKKGFDFVFDPGACLDCPGHCCRGTPGSIWVSQQEILQICSFLEVNTIDFIQKFLKQIGNRVSIKERIKGHDFQCVFFDDLKCQCTIYAVRPFQCRQYPFWEYFRRYKDHVINECPGVRTQS